MRRLNMHSIEIADIPMNYLLNFEIWDENFFLVTIATDISLHNLVPEFVPSVRLN